MADETTLVDIEQEDERLLEQLEEEDAAKEETEPEPAPPAKEGKKKEEKPRPPVKPFVHLHVHTEFSLLDGATRLVAPNHKDFPLVEKAIEKGMPGMAITDHGNMFGVFTFYKAMNKAGLKPVIGCEFYTCDNMHEQTGRNGSFNHLVLIAKNNVGYRNLVQLDSMAYVEGFYYKPRIDMETLRKHSEGVICLSGRMGLSGFFLCFLCESIMFPTIFALAIRGLDEQTKRASSYLIMSIVGGAVAPILMGYIADTTSMALGFIVPLVCFVEIGCFATRYKRVKS